jgi:hypothetical protein
MGDQENLCFHLNKWIKSLPLYGTQYINNCICWNVCYQNYPLLRSQLWHVGYYILWYENVDSENDYVMELSEFKKWKVKMCM